MADAIWLDPHPETLLYGAAYYPEYQPRRSVTEDLDLMQAADLTVIRVGESVWSSWEPQDGRFELEWLRPILDGAHDRGISVILGTPTYAIPPWLQILHPELAAEETSGVRKAWGHRQEVDYASHTFRKFAERVSRKILATYASHPAVIGFQVDNEPGMILFHNDEVFHGFKEYLVKRYGSAEGLNEAWGLTYWSHRLGSIDELWRPDGNSFPQYDLAWRQYQADLTTDFIAWQAAIVREYKSQEQFVTTCIAYPRPAQHDGQLVQQLDVVAGNPYYDMQDGLYLHAQPTEPAGFAVSGVGLFFRQADRMWSGRGERFLVTETNAQSIGSHSYNLPPYPGQLKQAALAFISRGAKMVEYWHWQTLNYGFETYWGGVLPHSGKPGRIYREVAEIGGTVKKIGAALEGFRPDADVALVYSNASKWAFEFSGPLRGSMDGADPRSYDRIFDSFYRGVVESNRQARIVQDITMNTMDAADFAAQHPVLIAPALYIASDDTLAWLRQYVAAGGHLVVGIRTGYADPEAWARAEIAPPRLNDIAGAWYEEFNTLVRPLGLRSESAFPLSQDAVATEWADGLIVDGGTALAWYDHPELGRFPAVTTHSSGSGRVTYVGTVPNPSLALDLASWLVPEPLSHGWAAPADCGVLIQSGETPSGRVSFVFNWSGQEATVTCPCDAIDIEADHPVAAGSTFVVPARGVRVFLHTSK